MTTMLRTTLLSALFLAACGGPTNSSGTSTAPGVIPFRSGAYTFTLSPPGGSLCADPAATMTESANGTVTGTVNIPACDWVDASGASHSANAVSAIVTGSVVGSSVNLTLSAGSGTASMSGSTEAWGVLGVLTPKASFANYPFAKLYAVAH